MNEKDTSARDATRDLAMEMAKRLLTDHMSRNRTWFKSPWPDEEGRYCIIQSHRIGEELPTPFPHEQLYYRELGDGWVISVGY